MSPKFWENTASQEQINEAEAKAPTVSNWIIKGREVESVDRQACPEIEKSWAKSLSESQGASFNFYPHTLMVHLFYILTFLRVHFFFIHLYPFSSKEE